jgi:hypothetical protein
MKHRWHEIGKCKAFNPINGATCEIALERKKGGLWNARCKGNEEHVFGPATLKELLSELTKIGIDEDELLGLFKSSGIKEAFVFSSRAIAVKALPNQDPLAHQLMRFWSPCETVVLKAYWSDDAASSRISVDPDDWLRIASGSRVWLDGGGYSYEGIGYRTSWCFNNPKFGVVTINYECRRDPSDSGVGSEDSIARLVVSREY